MLIYALNRYTKTARSGLVMLLKNMQLPNMVGAKMLQLNRVLPEFYGI